MIVFTEVMQRVKKVLSSQITKEKILDKDIAIALKVDPQNFAVMKRRKKIPYEALAYFGKKNKLSINWILFAQRPIYLE
ncbi:MAG: hypothetical protein KAH23_10665 [Kiritimatiellae bacterium]|nr:hypothetical protein [Kiritimatiellia bacterium]